jgi:putative endonuclease
MGTVYILYSEILDKYYTGSCRDLETRLKQHKNKVFAGAFTSKADDWILFYSINFLDHNQGRKIENHIKKMKSKKFIENLKKYPEIAERLKLRYQPGSPR